MPGPILWGPNNTAINLEQGTILPNGTLLNYNGPKNYIPNGSFENGSVTGWSLGTTGTLTNGLPTAASTPTFGSGITAGLTIATVNSGQLAGNYSMNYATSTTLSAGNMVATDAITLDIEDQAKVLTFKFYYKNVSGTTNFSGTSSNTYGVAVYDVTNSVYLSTVGAFSMTQSSGVGLATGTVQTGATTAQIRFIIYNVTATATTTSLYLDDIFLGPQTAPVGPTVTDWTTYTLTIGASTTAPTPGTNTSLAKWRRVGDSMEIIYYFAQTGAGSSGSGTYLFPLPTGYSIDTSKVTASTAGTNASGATVLGLCNISNTNTTNTAIAFMGPVIAYNTTNLTLFANGGTNQAEAPVTSSSFSLSGNPINYAFNVTVPIQGWSSNVQMSSDTDTRVVSWEGYTSSTQSATSGGTQITSWNTIDDTHGAFNLTNSSYVVPVSGYYQIEGSYGYSAAGAANQSYCYIYKNGSLLSNGPQNNQTTSQPGCVTFSNSFKLAAGDAITFYAYCQNTTALNAGSATGPGRWSIFRLSGPAVIAATESVNGRYNASTTTISSTSTAITFTNKTRDTHSAFNGTTWTCPVSGMYFFDASIAISGTIALNTQADIQIVQAGSAAQVSEILEYAGGAQTNLTVQIADEFYCQAGDTIQVKVSTTATSPSIVSSTSRNYFSWTRLGN